MVRQYASESGVGITSETLDNESLLMDMIKIPANVTVEEYFSVCHVIFRWIYSNLVNFVNEISLLYDTYILFYFLIP